MSSISQQISEILSSTHEWTLSVRPYVSLAAPSALKLFFPGLPLKRLRVKHRIHITACHLCSAIHSKFRNLGDSIPIKQLTKGMSKTGSLLDGVQLAETLGTAGVRGPQVSVLWRTVKHIRKEERGISLLHSSIDGKELLSRIDRAFKGKELTERQSQE
ncbi:hypothetical protein V6N12_070078 [Hibiscus sabdariffa]|uniref:Uncharacterized protein n=1 Tax=Hibiscus sabdariffa TaxID=183260 RepID=A0ABR2FFQ8_9ROSI